MLLFNLSSATLSIFFIISIQPMLLFNFARLSSSVTFTDFNTSHVIIQQNFRTGESGNNVFQYILCYYSTEKNYFKKE